MEPARDAITGHRSRCQGYAMPRVALRGRVITQRPRPANPLEQLIPPWLWIAPPVATTQSRRAVVTEPTTRGGIWYRGKALGS